RIFPKIRNAYFGQMPDQDIPALAEVLNSILRRINKSLNDPDYTFFIHTSPPQKEGAPSYDFYHWHIEIMPRLSIAAGLELGTNVFINVIDPDDAAATLRAVEI